MSTPQVVFDGWNTYVAERDGVTMFISFDEGAARLEPPAGLEHCARVIVPIHAPNANGGPVSPESEQLWAMEDQLCELLQEHGVKCRLVGRLTYSGWREIVFQLHDWDAFRPPVGLWMMQHKDYQIDVSEHEGWDFFNEYLRPTVEDQLVMADRDVIRALIEAGSDPNREHDLEYFFQGPAEGLAQVAEALEQRGYRPLGELDFASGEMALVKRLTLEPEGVFEESLANYHLAAEAGVDFNGWGAAVVR